MEITNTKTVQQNNGNRSDGKLEADKVVFSAIKPTGSLTIGNYIGAVKNWIALQKQYNNCIYSVADMHSITIDIEPATFRKNTLDMMALFIAFGLDPDKSTLFVQSHVTAHAELAWILNCNTQFGEAKRMTQFKDKSAKAPENVNVGLFDYPVLMAADILLYQSDYIPVGKDQLQHVELARTIAERFNNKYSPTFTLPQGLMPKYGAKVYSLSEPTAKMGKSDANPNGYVLLLDDADTIMRKLKRAVTDSDTHVAFSADKPGISNLLTIYSSFADVTMDSAVAEFENTSYADFKVRVADAIIAGLDPLQRKYSEVIADKAYLSELMKNGAEKAARMANKTLSKVYKKVGFVKY